jgi:hypothetical protein
LVERIGCGDALGPPERQIAGSNKAQHQNGDSDGDGARERELLHVIRQWAHKAEDDEGTVSVIATLETAGALRLTRIV